MVNRDTERPKIKPMTKEITMFLEIGTCILKNLEDIKFKICNLVNITTEILITKFSLESEVDRCSV